MVFPIFKVFAAGSKLISKPLANGLKTVLKNKGAGQQVFIWAGNRFHKFEARVTSKAK